MGLAAAGPGGGQLTSPGSSTGTIPGAWRSSTRAAPGCGTPAGDISDQKAEGLYHFTLDAAQARLEYALKMGWQVLTPECGEYPECLRNIPDPPAVLYVQGQLPDLDSGPAIAVTGARSAWESSIRAAERIGYQLAAGDAVVVSGEAKGVDSAALKGALTARGRTVVRAAGGPGQPLPAGERQPAAVHPPAGRRPGHRVLHPAQPQQGHLPPAGTGSSPA